MLSSENNDTLIRVNIETTLTAQGYNVTNGLVNNVLRILKKYEQMDPNNTIHPNETDDCGGRLKVLANSYASDYHFYCSVIICLLGIVANCLNIIVLTRKDMASVPINRILTALAWADMLLMVEYIPFTIYYTMDSEEKAMSYKGAVYALFHMHVTQYLHTTSICLTLTLAIWRFLAIR